MPNVLHATENLRQISVRVSEGCMEHMTEIRNFKGGSVTAMAAELIEATKQIKPHNWHRAIAAMQQEGQKG